MIPISQAPISFTEVLRALYADLMNNSNGFSILQQSLSKYLNCKNIILTNSGSTALYSLLRAYKLKTDDEVISPAYLCENVPKLIKDMGFKIKFVDIEPFTYNMDPKDLTKKITNNTKVVIAVHMFGYPCSIEDITEIAHDHGALVIEDAAQAMGAEYKGETIGTFGDSGFFSMGMGKPITTITGGAICTKDEKIVKNSDILNLEQGEFYCNLVEGQKKKSLYKARIKLPKAVNSDYGEFEKKNTVPQFIKGLSDEMVYQNFVQVKNDIDSLKEMYF